MGRFVNGVLIGVGVGLLIAPMRGEEMQRLVRQRYQQLRSNLPEKEQVMSCDAMGCAEGAWVGWSPLRFCGTVEYKGTLSGFGMSRSEEFCKC